MLNVYHLADGRVQQKFSAGAILSAFLAADASSGTVFGSVILPGGLQVRQWSLAADAVAVGAVGGPGGVVVADAGTKECPYRPLTVMPPVPGKLVSHLVVGSFHDPELLVIALPELRLVHRHELLGMRVSGLAADPWGRALVVGDANTMRVLPWPLLGMEELA